MDESMLKTSWKQRLAIAIIAAIMLGATIISYIFIILNKTPSTTSESNIDQELINRLSKEQAVLSAQVNTESVNFSKQYFDEFLAYKTNVKAYNAATVNGGGVESKDLKIGSGAELSETSTDYFAYYVGWCANEEVFDTSFNNFENPTALKAPLDGATSFIEGWTQGVIGMRIGGVREISIPGELAYGETQEICGGFNSPLKFIIMAVEKTEPLATLISDLDTANLRLQYAQYGLDYDQFINQGTAE